VTVYEIDEPGFAETLTPVVESKLVDGDQVYELAPLDVKVATPPSQIVALLTSTIGDWFTLTILVIVAVHPLKLVPVIVYVIVAVGLAETVDPVVEERFVAGDHIYVFEF